MLIGITTLIMMLPILQSGSTTLVCSVERKTHAAGEYPVENLDTYEPRTIIVFDAKTANVSRCSISPSAGWVETCDTYAIDHVEFDPIASAKKYYFFGAQFDIQVFENGDFVENNGRGTISFGKCS